MTLHPAHRTNLGHKHSIKHSFVLAAMVTLIFAVFFSTFDISWKTILVMCTTIGSASLTFAYILLIGKR